LTLGIYLAKNHPVIADTAFVKEMQDKIKGINIAANPGEVSF
jgi:hypothetical protein